MVIYMNNELAQKTISINNEKYKINIPEDFDITDTHITKSDDNIGNLEKPHPKNDKIKHF